MIEGGEIVPDPVVEVVVETPLPDEFPDPTLEPVVETSPDSILSESSPETPAP